MPTAAAQEVLEKLISSRLAKAIHAARSYPQDGFRTGGSTADVIMQAVEAIEAHSRG